MKLPTRTDQTVGLLPSSSPKHDNNVVENPKLRRQLELPSPLNPNSELWTCRGRYEINLYRAHFRIHGAKYDHKMAYEDVNNFFLLEKPRLVVRAMGRGLSIDGGIDGRFPLLLCVGHSPFSLLLHLFPKSLNLFLPQIGSRTSF